MKRFDDRVRHIFEQEALGVFAPLFFAAAGLRVDLGQLADPGVLGVGLLVLAIAIVGKFVGATSAPGPAASATGRRCPSVPA